MPRSSCYHLSDCLLLFYLVERLLTDLVQRLLTDSLLKLLEADEAALLAVEDGVPELDEAVPPGDPVQVLLRHLVGVGDGADHSPGDVCQAVSEVSLMKQRH